MPNYRNEQKLRLKNYLQEIIYNAANLNVYIFGVVTAKSYPLVLIQSADSDAISLIDNNTYETSFRYSIQVIQLATDDESRSSEIEANFDEIEGLIIDKLLSREVRNDESFVNDKKWIDIEIEKISSPYLDVQNNLGNLIKKTFDIKVQTLIQHI
jgi:hypothetical protein